MRHIAVIYQPKYDSARQHAQWTARDLGAEPLERSAVSPTSLREYDVVVHGDDLRAGGIISVNLVVEYPYPPLVVFTVGLTNLAITDYSEILNQSSSPEQGGKLEVFHSRGTMDYGRLGPVHRDMMTMMKKMTTDSKTPEEWTDEGHLMLGTYRRSVDFTGEASIASSVGYVKGLL